MKYSILVSWLTWSATGTKLAGSEQQTLESKVSFTNGCSREPACQSFEEQPPESFLSKVANVAENVALSVAVGKVPGLGALISSLNEEFGVGPGPLEQLHVDLVRTFNAKLDELDISRDVRALSRDVRDIADDLSDYENVKENEAESLVQLQEIDSKCESLDNEFAGPTRNPQALLAVAPEYCQVCFTARTVMKDDGRISTAHDSLLETARACIESAPNLIARAVQDRFQHVDSRVEKTGLRFQPCVTLNPFGGIFSYKASDKRAEGPIVEWENKGVCQPTHVLQLAGVQIECNGMEEDAAACLSSYRMKLKAAMADNYGRTIVKPAEIYRASIRTPQFNLPSFRSIARASRVPTATIKVTSRFGFRLCEIFAIPTRLTSRFTVVNTFPLTPSLLERLKRESKILFDAPQAVKDGDVETALDVLERNDKAEVTAKLFGASFESTVGTVVLVLHESLARAKRLSKIMKVEIAGKPFPDILFLAV